MKKLMILLAMLVAGYASFAQKAKANPDTTKTSTVITTNYVCPMHPDVTSDKSGKCSKCGMNLSLSPKEKMKREVVKLHTCPKHTDVTSDKPGKCPRCGMDLTLSPKEKMKREVVKLYTCPMHPEETGDKSRKCPTCGMDMVKKKSKNN